MSTLALLGIRASARACFALALVVAASVCSAAAPLPCVDATSVKLRLHDLGERLAELTAMQRSRAEAIRALIADRAQSRGWSAARQSEVIAQYLESERYVVLQAKRAPNEIILDRVKNLLRTQPVEQNARAACEQLESAMAAADENFRINEQQYDLAREFIEGAQ